MMKMPKEMPSRAELLSDSAVYQRTVSGQRMLVQSRDPGSSHALRMLARVNGYTDLRRLVDLAPEDAGELTRAIPELVRQGLIELVRDATDRIDGIGRPATAPPEQPGIAPVSSAGG